VTRKSSIGVLVVLGVLASAPAIGGPPGSQADPKSIEAAVLAAHDGMTRAGEAADADRLFRYMAETDKGSVIQNGVILLTRQAALDQVRNNLRGVSSVKYDWKRRLVTVLSPEIAVLVAEADATITRASGDSFTAPLAQTIVFVLKDGSWKAIHAHHSSPRAQ
jgi:uncharacterized protein (TIGR02246 family)